MYVRKSGELNFYYLYDVDLNLVGVDLLVILWFIVSFLKMWNNLM